MLWFLSSCYPELPLALKCGAAMAAGISTSLAIETAALQVYEGFPLRQAAATAWNMSFISMLSMELAENAVDIALTGGQFAPAEPLFWLALGPSLLAGFLVPLPYNYYQLKAHGRSCH